MMPRQKQALIIEDPRSHAPEQLAELRLLLEAGVPRRPDPRRPGFFEVEGAESVYYIFQYPSGTKVMLLGVWERDPVAQLASACAPAA
jgi:hypothetical protein